MTAHDTNGPMDRARTERLLGALAKCAGRGARVVAFTESHAMLVLRVALDDGQSVTLMCGECARVEFSRRWMVGRINYVVRSSAPYRYGLTDEAGAFRVDCGVVVVADDPDDWKRGEIA